MSSTYIVFINGLSGFKMIPQMSADTLKEAIQNIQEGCVGCCSPSQNWMYYIYRLHEQGVSVIGTRMDVYKRVKAVAGSLVEKPHTDSHEYALTHQSSMAWFFTDDIFGDR